MKLLKEIIFGCKLLQIHGHTNKAIEEVCIDSREIKRNALFIAIVGNLFDGHQFIPTAIQQGAIAVICSEIPKDMSEGVTYVVVEDTSRSAGIIASHFFDNPSHNLKLVGITGTNGKTSVATLGYQLMRSLGYKAGLLSTVSIKINDVKHEATHTTPDAISINRWLAVMVAAGCEYCFMEVSSHAIDQKRTAGLQFEVAAFTNISHDHLDYHGSFKNYILAKKAFFDDLHSGAYALVNSDDANGSIMLQNTLAKKRSYSVKSPSDFKTKILDNAFTGLHLILDEQEIHTRLIGKFNAYNLTCVYAIGRLLNQDRLQILTTLTILKPARGRFEYFRTEGNITVIVDYAHTPDALENVLSTIQEIRAGNEKVITLVGCGGDRDKTKRPEMARIACELSDRVIFTSDNPRSEDPIRIIEDMKAGVPGEHFKKYTSNPDREEAIKQAYLEAEGKDILLIAGKGHETYQEVQGVKHNFDDIKTAMKTAKLLNK